MTDNKWFSTGFPSNPSWGWNKASPKKSLLDIGIFIFNVGLVEFVHWAYYSSILMAQSILIIMRYGQII